MLSIQVTAMSFSCHEFITTKAIEKAQLIFWKQQWHYEKQERIKRDLTENARKFNKATRKEYDILRLKVTTNDT